MKTTWIKQIVIALFIAVSILFLRHYVHEVTKDIFLPSIFLWSAESTKMYVVYLIVLMMVISGSIRLLDRYYYSKHLTFFVLFVLWLSFPTYKHWDVRWLDYMFAVPKEDVYIVVPVLLSIEHLFWIEFDSIYILISTLAYMGIVRFILATRWGGKLTLYSKKEFLQLLYSFIGIMIVSHLLFVAYINKWIPLLVPLQ